jgi:hypothetical protein
MLVENQFVIFDTDCDDKLTLQDFITYYVKMAQTSPDTVRHHLRAHEIGIDMLPFNSEEEVNRDRMILPRYQIANDSERLEMLFSLPEKEVWDVIRSLQTNKKLYMDILTNQPDIISAAMPTHKLLYTL